MAYIFGLPSDVTDLIYSFRDPLNWNGDKYRTTPLGALFKSGHFEIVREPAAPYFQYFRGEISRIDDHDHFFLELPNITIWERMRSSFFCYTDVACVWLRDADVFTKSASVILN